MRLIQEIPILPSRQQASLATTVAVGVSIVVVFRDRDVHVFDRETLKHIQTCPVFGASVRSYNDVKVHLVFILGAFMLELY